MIFAGEEGETREHGLEVINKWLICVSDYVITYVKESDGDACRFKKIAEEKEKNVIEIYKGM